MAWFSEVPLDSFGLIVLILLYVDSFSKLRCRRLLQPCLHFLAQTLSPSSSLSDKPPHPLPQCIEVPFSQEDITCIRHTVEPIKLDGDLTLNKCRVSTADVFGLSNSDLVPGKYEGGLKLWEGSLDLVKILHSHIQDGQLTLHGKRVLELGCGHGLPGIYACLTGAVGVHFQDFNAEVLRCLTIPNVKANIQEHLHSRQSSSETATDAHLAPELRFFAGDWSEVHWLFHHGNSPSSELDSNVGYDVILMAETVYSVSSLGSLYELIKKSLRRPHGVVYLAAKRYYFGVGGGTREFRSVVEADGILEAFLIATVADGVSNVRELWKFSFK